MSTHNSTTLPTNRPHHMWQEDRYQSQHNIRARCGNGVRQMRKCVFVAQHCFETRSHQITNHDACTFAFYIIIHYTRRLTLILCHIHTHIQRTNRISEANCATTRTWASFCSRFPHELHPRGTFNWTGADQWDQVFSRFSHELHPLGTFNWTGVDQ